MNSVPGSSSLQEIGPAPPTVLDSGPWYDTRKGLKYGAWDLFSLQMTKTGHSPSRNPHKTQQIGIFRLEPMDAAAGYSLAQTLCLFENVSATSTYSVRDETVTLTICSRKVREGTGELIPPYELLREAVDWLLEDVQSLQMSSIKVKEPTKSYDAMVTSLT